MSRDSAGTTVGSGKCRQKTALIRSTLPTKRLLAKFQYDESDSSSSSETSATDTTSATSTEAETTNIRPEESQREKDPAGHSSLQYVQASKCPAAQLEFAKITAAYPKLRSTGCSDTFCQSGRMTKTSEHRVGHDRSVEETQSEARDFLHQLRSEQIIDTDETLHQRLESVLDEISRTSVTCDPISGEDCHLHDRSTTSLIGGTWSQSLEELKHGVQLAWKHSQKCIMRSEYQTLELCDLRHVTSSKEMCTSLIAGLREAFNGGKITPTVFAFPPRQPGKRGPMIWNQQLLSFAAYERDDGNVLGDPANLQLTKDIIELGWRPPSFKTRWDLLPIVAMAEGEDPFIMEVPEDDFPLVLIGHPEYERQFERLGLRWVPVPALSRHGFDVGGVQYTATPFIGWFMDAEIGVRDLADSFRYNALPHVATAMGWVESEQELDRLPEYERLVILSRAQAELNYAVFHSFQSSGVAMSDSLSASSMYCTYDDEHFRTKGYRLPSNPYWLAPPQGSIVPVWHRGGAPNYQPSPMICRHIQDPVKAWKREQRMQILQACHRNPGCVHSSPVEQSSPALQQSTDHRYQAPEEQNKPRIYICFCSAASTAKKLANDLHRRLGDSVKSQFTLNRVTALNDFSYSNAKPHDVLLIVASTAGHGEMPLNGQRFLKINMIGHVATSIQFSIFGNGSTLYGDRYNGAAKTIQQHLQKQNATPLDNGLYAGDTAKENPPWTQFDEWYQYIIEKLRVESDSSKQFVRQQSMSTTKSWTAIVSTYHTTKLISCNRAHKQGIQRVVLDIGEQQYNPLSHVSMIVPNEPKVVQRALRTIGLDGKEPIRSIDSRDMTIKEYLTSFVDFDKPFSNIDWVRSWNFSRSQKRLISEVPVRKALQAFTWPWRNSIATESLLKAMPLKTPRMYSAASSQERLRDCDTGDLLELLIQHRKGGAVSDFLETAQPGACIQLRTNPLDEEIEINTPVICFATGSGLAPVLSLLRHRLASTSRPRATGNLTIAGPITLILGFRASDSPIIGEVLREAITCGVIDILLLTPSNDCKVRAQDRIFEDSVRYRIDKKLKHDNASVFVCALPEAADGFARNLSALVGCDIQDSLGDKYIEQVYKPAC